MFGLPQWAIGVGAVLVLVTALQVIYVRLMPPEYRRRRWKGEPLQVEDAMQRRLAELDDVKQRLGELEERVDFAECLLAKQRESERLGPSQ
jgi:predicted nuclease with TOPRIM domain